MEKVTSSELANYIVRKRANPDTDEGRFANSMVHKLIYYIQCYSLAWTDESVLIDYPYAASTGPQYDLIFDALDQQNDPFHMKPLELSSDFDREMPGLVVKIESAVWDTFKTSNGYFLGERAKQESLYAKTLKNEHKVYLEEDIKTYFKALSVIDGTYWD